MRVLLFLALLLGACSPPVKFNATELTGIDWGKDFALTDHNGKLRRLADFKGRAVVMFSATRNARMLVRLPWATCVS